MVRASWVPSGAVTDFPLQNLPFGVFSVGGGAPRCGVAIESSVLDLRAAAAAGLLAGLEGVCADAVFGAASTTLNALMALERPQWRAVRAAVGELLAADGADARLRDSAALQAKCLVALADVTMHLPATIGDYTDFYSSREHATNVGTMFRGADNALQPNWLHLPVGYHGRASSVVVSGTEVPRPRGQVMVDKTDPKAGSKHSPCNLMDFELEMAFFVGGQSNALGAPVKMDDAEDRIFGFVLMNDWSARDIQKWEYVPLGPFGAKNFATTISPWVVSLDALEPFRCQTSAVAQTDPKPLDYLVDPTYSSWDLKLTVGITEEGGSTPTTVSQSNFRHMYWTAKQQLVHHSVTGCNMVPGDLLASGTISGSDETMFGSMLELSWMGKKEVGPLKDGSIRKFLKDGDTVTITGVCAGDEYSIGFGPCAGKVLPAGTLAPAPAAAAVSPLPDAVLSSYWRSSSSWRARIALAKHNVPYEYKAVNLLQGAQKECGPLGQVPALSFTSAGETVTLSQSLPIIELVDEVCGAGADEPLLPRDPVVRARAREFAEICNAGVQPLQNLAVIRGVKSAEVDGAEVDGKGFGKLAIAKGLAAMEILAAKGNGKFAVGTHVTIADCCLVPQMYNARRFLIDLDAFPTLVAVDAHLATLPEFVAAHPDQMPDAVKA